MEDRDHDLLIRIDENMKNLMNNHQTHVVSDAAQFAKDDIRLTNLERSFWRIMGGVSVIVVIAEVIMKHYLK